MSGVGRLAAWEGTGGAERWPAPRHTIQALTRWRDPRVPGEKGEAKYEPNPTALSPAGRGSFMVDEKPSFSRSPVLE